MCFAAKSPRWPERWPFWKCVIRRSNEASKKHHEFNRDFLGTDVERHSSDVGSSVSASHDVDKMRLEDMGRDGF
jgi:hypothetical protein